MEHNPLSINPAVAAAGSAAGDTICAISTPHGVGGIAVARVSGPGAIPIVDTIWRGKQPLSAIRPRVATLGDILDTRGDILDQALVTLFPAPHSYTGQDTIEISTHGSRWIQQELINTLIQAGCRLAEPGEYTRRAFATGRIGLTEAEGIADIIASTSRASHRLAISQMRGSLSRRLAQLREQLLQLSSLLELELDFSEEDVEFASRPALLALAHTTLDEIERLASTFASGNAIKEGIPVAIAGATNAGKSSLLNQLLGDDRAIVSPIHGTTRDIIEDTTTLGDYTFRFIDTAGLRHASDPIEAIGIDRARQAIHRARIVIHLVDATAPTPVDSLSGIPAVDGYLGDEASVASLGSSIPAPPGVEGASAAPLSTLGSSIPTPPDVEGASVSSPNSITGVSADVSGVGISGEGVSAGISEVKARVAGVEGPTVITVANKIDLLAAEAPLPEGIDIAISALTGQGIDTLRERLIDIAAATESDSQILITNARHYQALRQAAEATTRVVQGLQAGLSGDLIAQDLRLTLHHLGEITGAITPADILHSIFSRFCIGK